MHARKFAALIILMLACGPASPGDAVDEVRVLTRNIYVGADIFRVVEAPDTLTLITEIVAVYNTVLQTNFPERAQALADEILATNPHVIGLQEVSLIRSQDPGDILIGNPLPATDVEFDYLQILLDELALRGLNYSVAAVTENADVELPLLAETVRDIRLTDRDVILVRDDVIVANSESDNFSDSVIIDLSGAVIVFKRGFNMIDAWISGRPYRIVNVHFEVGGPFGAAIQQLQASELIATLDDALLPVILLGDINSSPQSDPQQAFGQLLAAGYTDSWPLYSALPGYTCCHNETLDDPASQLTSRIDVVMVRNPAAAPTTVSDAAVLGDQPADLTPSGLWPSDHAGLFAALQVAIPDSDQDGVDDLQDNCLLAANPGQLDTDADGFGNRCDADLNQSGFTNFADLALFRNDFFSNNLNSDLDGDGSVTFSDLAIFKTLFGSPPGPAAPVPPAD